MGTLDRLRRTAPPDAAATLLSALFAAPVLDAGTVSPDLLARVPLPRLAALLASLTERHGELRAVRPKRGLYLLEFAHGEELVHAALDPDGRLSSLVTGPGALLARATTRTVPVPRPESPTLAAGGPADGPARAEGTGASGLRPRAPRRAAGAGGAGAGARSAAVVGLQRLLGVYCAATAVELVLPWLSSTGPGWALVLAQTPAFAWYLLRTAPTHTVPPWFRWLAFAPAASGLLAGFRAWHLPWATRPGVLEPLFLVGMAGFTAWTWRRSRPVAPPPVSHPLVLRFPLRGGAFAFTEAGGPAVSRYAEESLIPGGDRSRRYATDIVQLGDGPQWRGRRALGLSPTANNRYAVFGHPVHSPVDGVVLSVLDGLPDHPPRHGSAAHPDGNHVVIDTGRGLVVLAWLRRDSIRVQRGKHVTAGQLVGAVGNSGGGTEPALHLRAENGVGLGLPIRFAEQKGAPLRGRRITAGE